MADAERRRASRVRTKDLVSNASFGNRRVITSVGNLSTAGAFLHTSQVLPPGTKIALELFEAGSKRPLVLSGRVANVVDPDAANRRKVPFGMGIEFDGLTADQGRRIAALLEELGGEPAAKAPVAPPPPTGEIKRRRNRRVESKGAVANVRMKNEVVALSAPVDNLSMGGLFLESAEPLRLGAVIDLELIFGGKSVVVAGAVAGVVTRAAAEARHVAAGLSVRFTPMRRQTADKLSALLAAIAPAAALGLRSEEPPEGYLEEPGELPVVRGAAEPALPPHPEIFEPSHPSMRGIFDFDARDLGVEVVVVTEPETPQAELKRLRAEVALRQERIAELERQVLGDDEPLPRR